jgi:hypothetical protein
MATAHGRAVRPYSAHRVTPRGPRRPHREKEERNEREAAKGKREKGEREAVAAKLHLLYPLTVRWKRSRKEKKRKRKKGKKIREIERKGTCDLQNSTYFFQKLAKCPYIYISTGGKIFIIYHNLRIFDISTLSKFICSNKN